MDGFPIVATETGFRCPGFGEFFQSRCRSSEWKAALVVWEKYKRKSKLDHSHLLRLRTHVEAFSLRRKTEGKPAHIELLKQEASAYLRSWN